MIFTDVHYCWLFRLSLGTGFQTSGNSRRCGRCHGTSSISSLRSSFLKQLPKPLGMAGARAKDQETAEATFGLCANVDWWVTELNKQKTFINTVWRTNLSINIQKLSGNRPPQIVLDKPEQVNKPCQALVKNTPTEFIFVCWILLVMTWSQRFKLTSQAKLRP